MLVAIIGGIGSGKSMLGYFLKEKGFTVLDSDIVAREVVESGSEGLRRVLEEFGEEYRLDDGSLNRAKLAQKVFTDAESLQRLNEITHPLIAARLQERLAACVGSHVFVEIPLFMGSGLEQLFDEVWLVISDRDTRLARIMGRDKLTPEQAANRIDCQMSDEELSACASKILYNNGNIGDFKKQIDALI